MADTPASQVPAKITTEYPAGKSYNTGPRGSKLDRIRGILTDTSFVENKARSLVRQVFAEEELKIEALLISATRAKLMSIDKLFSKLEVIENKFFETQRDAEGKEFKLIDKLSAKELVSLYETLSKTMIDLYKDLQEDANAIKQLEEMNARKGKKDSMSREQRDALKLVVDKVLARMGTQAGKVLA